MQSERKSRHDSLQVIEAEVSRLDVSPGVFRRRWSQEAKARILEAAMAPGANASAVARAHGLKPQQIFAWRRQASAFGTSAATQERPAFTPVEIDRSGSVELIVGEVLIRAGCEVSPGRLAEIVRALRSA